VGGHSRRTAPDACHLHRPLGVQRSLRGLLAAGSTDSSPDGRTTLGALEAAAPADDIDVVTKEDLSREIQLEIDLHDAKWHLRDLNVIASPVQDIRSVLDLMPTDTPMTGP
jgi:hypothetical protein